MLTLKNLSLTAADAQGRADIVKNVSLDVEDGKFLVITGPNGGGKTTLAKLIMGLATPTGGQIFLDGEDITYMPEHKRSLMVGRLFQDPLKGTAPGMTIEENLALAYLRTAKGKSPFSRISKKDKDAFRERLSLLNMGLEDFSPAVSARRSPCSWQPSSRRSFCCSMSTLPPSIREQLKKYWS